ncbi:hypothetical protein CgunFtcFv8_024928 [Champsocephalus gunnari]|uniref:Uncharacterized protein n=1 Tax=Champsocephalus gunnari TaxID=52237 RepID=A0AAN8DDT9_CHAGU|nr:hypothetical protein CgunFtcFv8_024928 [Champsocephalus gunnari]
MSASVFQPEAGRADLVCVCARDPQPAAAESSHRVPDSSGVRERGVHLGRLVAWRGPARSRQVGREKR